MVRRLVDGAYMLGDGEPQLIRIDGKMYVPNRSDIRIIAIDDQTGEVEFEKRTRTGGVELDQQKRPLKFSRVAAVGRVRQQPLERIQPAPGRDDKEWPSSTTSSSKPASPPGRPPLSLSSVLPRDDAPGRQREQRTARRRDT